MCSIIFSVQLKTGFWPQRFKSVVQHATSINNALITARGHSWVSKAPMMSTSPGPKPQAYDRCVQAYHFQQPQQVSSINTSLILDRAVFRFTSNADLLSVDRLHMGRLLPL